MKKVSESRAHELHEKGRTVIAVIGCRQARISPHHDIYKDVHRFIDDCMPFKYGSLKWYVE